MPTHRPLPQEAPDVSIYRRKMSFRDHMTVIHGPTPNHWVELYDPVPSGRRIRPELAIDKSGRELAAWLGLVPRQSGTGGRLRLLGISKHGDTYLRTLLIHGARSVLTHSKEPPTWATKLAQRRPQNVAIVALANKMARTIWALLAHERKYQREFVSKSTLA